jgi:hypothetical protein
VGIRVVRVLLRELCDSRRFPSAIVFLALHYGGLTWPALGHRNIEYANYSFSS